eukprot:scaffold1406_cov115-Isochrysis_galbana.AAC.1
MGARSKSHESVSLPAHRAVRPASQDSISEFPEGRSYSWGAPGASAAAIGLWVEDGSGCGRYAWPIACQSAPTGRSVLWTAAFGMSTCRQYACPAHGWTETGSVAPTSLMWTSGCRLVMPV